MKRHAISGLMVVAVLTGCGGPMLGPAVMAANPQTHSQFIVGWWGESGRERALVKFSSEEGRQLTYKSDEKGARMAAKLTKGESEVLGSVLAQGINGAKKIEKRDLPDGLYRKAVRHLKLFRRQKATHDSSRTLVFSKVVGPDTKPIAFIAGSKSGYQAFYTNQGRLMVATALTKLNAGEPADPVPPPEDMEADE